MLILRHGRSNGDTAGPRVHGALEQFEEDTRGPGEIRRLQAMDASTDIHQQLAEQAPPYRWTSQSGLPGPAHWTLRGTRDPFSHDGHQQVDISADDWDDEPALQMPYDWAEHGDILIIEHRNQSELEHRLPQILLGSEGQADNPIGMYPLAEVWPHVIEQYGLTPDEQETVSGALDQAGNLFDAIGRVR